MRKIKQNLSQAGIRHQAEESEEELADMGSHAKTTWEWDAATDHGARQDRTRDEL
jgi:hypothetical protein